MIIKKGEVGHTFYIITEGSVSCSAEPFNFDESSLLSTKSISPKFTKEGVLFQSMREEAFSGSTTVQSEESSLSDTGTPSPSSHRDQLNDQDTVPSVSNLNKGDWFGEIALLSSDSRRTANVVASSPIVKLLAFNRDSFEKALGSLKDIIDKKSFFRAVPSLFENLPKDKVM
jgi:CRP-like cAMP-binding protein